MPRMKAMVDDVLASIPLMANVAALLGFIFFIFGLAGTRFFGHGSFRQQCWVPFIQYTNNTNETIWKSNGQSCGGDVKCLKMEVCDIFYPSNHSQGYNENPGDGFVGFDNIGMAFLTIFQCLSLEGWVDVMYVAQDTVGWYAIFFFVPLIIIGSLFVMQLTLAVVANNYHTPESIIEKSGLDVKNNANEAEEEDSSSSDEDSDEDEEKEKEKDAIPSLLLEGEKKEEKKEDEKENEKENEKKNGKKKQLVVEIVDIEEVRNKNGCDQAHTSNPELWDIDGTEMDWNATYICGSHLWYIQTRAKDRHHMTPKSLPIAGLPLNDNATNSKRLYMQQVKNMKKAAKKAAKLKTKEMELANAAKQHGYCSIHNCFPKKKANEPIPDTNYYKLKTKIKTIVTADWYQWAMLGLIMLNTTLLAMDHYPIPDGFEQALDDWGIPFTVIFTIEVFVKIWSMGYSDWKKGR